MGLAVEDSGFLSPRPRDAVALLRSFETSANCALALSKRPITVILSTERNWIVSSRGHRPLEICVCLGPHLPTAGRIAAQRGQHVTIDELAH